jgi:hypothetical protein
MLKESTSAKRIETSHPPFSFGLPTMKKDTFAREEITMATSAQDQWAQ